MVEVKSISLSGTLIECSDNVVVLVEDCQSVLVLLGGGVLSVILLLPILIEVENLSLDFVGVGLGKRAFLVDHVDTST